MPLSRRDKFNIRIQRVISHALFILIGPLMSLLCRYKFRYHVESRREIRKRYSDMLKAAEGPVIVCTNHLTLIDSIIQSVTLGSTWKYLTNFSSLPWNVPEKTNFYGKISWRILCYLGKCIPVERMTGPQNARKNLAKMGYVLSLGDVISIFPEGKRSRTGFIDENDFSYGPGDLLKEHENTTVICVYMRGLRNGGFADFPEKNQSFYFSIKCFNPDSKLSGLRKVRDISTQIIHELKQMEREFFQHEKLCR